MLTRAAPVPLDLVLRRSNKGLHCWQGLQRRRKPRSGLAAGPAIQQGVGVAAVLVRAVPAALRKHGHVAVAGGPRLQLWQRWRRWPPPPAPVRQPRKELEGRVGLGRIGSPVAQADGLKGGGLGGGGGAGIVGHAIGIVLGPAQFSAQRLLRLGNDALHVFQVLQATKGGLVQTWWARQLCLIAGSQGMVTASLLRPGLPVAWGSMGVKPSTQQGQDRCFWCAKLGCTLGYMCTDLLDEGARQQPVALRWGPMGVKQPQLPESRTPSS